ncbi:MAG: radical SAM family heme chaperone HemW, partial [Planctomycetes bacterium]|nr:radical SAM family heme chaperone HemW [Planctomycetota bacterium]
MSCDFCAFYQEKPFRKDVVAFLKGVGKERDFYPEVGKVDTFYFGGGTPGILSTKDLEILGRTLLEGLGEPSQEWTIELAPSTVKTDKVRMLKELGVTRISMGVQSFDQDLLDKLGRPHRPDQAIKAFDTIRSEGFENVNLDLIFAVPGQTVKMLEKDLEQAVRLAPDHLSTYCLTYEEDTPLRHRLAEGLVRREIDDEADLYSRTWEILESAGYAQYEISNFARPGFQCVHNLNTWSMHRWIGLGPAAASQHRGARYANPASLEAWLKGVDDGEPVREDEVVLSERLLAEDSLLFGLRMSRGISPRRIERRYEGIDLSFLEPLWRELMSEGLLEEKPGDHLALTLRGKLL